VRLLTEVEAWKLLRKSGKLSQGLCILISDLKRKRLIDAMTAGKMGRRMTMLRKKKFGNDEWPAYYWDRDRAGNNERRAFIRETISRMTPVLVTKKKAARKK
jgi:hypothetical protein